MSHIIVVKFVMFFEKTKNEKRPVSAHFISKE